MNLRGNVWRWKIERRMKANDVVGILTWLEAKHGTPGAIRSDDGPEFIARAIQRWLAARKSAPMYCADAYCTGQSAGEV
jgi:hypothetical protein